MCVIVLQVYEGYGQTETAGGLTFTLKHEINGGHVGSPLAGLKVRLEDVPEMNYFSKENRGEVSDLSCFLNSYVIN